MGKFIKPSDIKAKIVSIMPLRFVSRHKKMAIIVGTAVAVLVVVAIMFVPKTYQAYQEDQAERKRIYELDGNSLNGAVGEAFQNNDLQKAQDAIEGNKEAESKGALILSASIYNGQKKYEEALEKLMLAEKKYGLDSTIAMNIAQTKAFLGDKNGAIEYYQKAIELLKQEKPENLEQEIKGIESFIKALQ
jgi:tetratricopeptide (TPR) repeat protein